MVRDQTTIVLGVDGKYAEQLRLSVLTWRKFQPWLFDQPWVVFFDRATIDAKAAGAVLSPSPAEMALVPWPPKGVGYESQRERMLSGFVHVPAETVQTDWWLKIDCDAICTGPAEFPREEWFEPPCPSAGEHTNAITRDAAPVIVGSPWHYTKPGGQMDLLNDWADGIEGLRSFPRLDFSACERSAKRLYHPRYCSWLAFHRTSWTRIAASYCQPYRVPVPSQDGYHFFIAARRADPIRTLKMKRHGWTNISKLDNLRTKVAEILDC